MPAIPLSSAKFDAAAYDVIVVGSGIGGLGLAVLCAQHGWRVLVLEQHYVAGGFTHTFSRKGYEWDVGVHYVGEVHRETSLLRRLLDHVTDGELKWAAMADPYDKLIYPDRQYDLYSGKEAFVDRLSQDFPGESGAIREYVRLIYEVQKQSRNFYTQKLVPSWVSGVSRPFLERGFRKYSDQTTLSVLKKLTTNEKLIGVLTAQWGDYGLPPSQSSFAIHAMVAKHYINGGAYPIGGSAQFADTMIPIIEKAGGQVVVKAKVKKVLIRQGEAYGVELEDGQKILSRLVASDAGAIITFKNLISDDVDVKPKLMSWLKTVEPSLSHVCLYAGLKHSTKDLGLTPGNLWIYPDYDYDRPIQNFLKNPESDLPLAYVSFPSAKDPSWESRYPGRTTLEVISFAPYEWFAKWDDTKWKKRGEEYEAYKKTFEDRLVGVLEKYVPQVKGKLDHIETSTPLTTKHFSAYENGEIYGLNHTPERFRQPWLTPRTPIKNLYLTGQDVVSDGIAGALFGGVLTASALMGRNVLKDII